MSNRRNRPPNKYGCKPDSDVCVEHDMPLVCKHGCEKRTAHNCRDPVEGDVYVINSDHRRVIGVKGGRVCYSIGTDLNHWCNLATFREWFRTAMLTHDGSKK